MKVKFLALFLLCGPVQLPAQVIVQQFFAIGSMPAPTADMDLPKPTTQGNVLIAMPGPTSNGVKVLSVTDNAPAGSNTYKQVPGAASSCAKTQTLDIWYCENCNGGATELKFHLSGNARASINVFLELSNMPQSSILDGAGAHLDDGTRTSASLEVGPALKTTATDFVVARYTSTNPLPTGVVPESWTYKTTHVYKLNAPAGTYQPTLTGGGTAGNFCMSMAAFKTAPPAAASAP
jgi:hypothetical protein